VFALPGLVLLVCVDYFKPQEYVPFLAGIPLLYLFTALALLGFLVDLRLGLSRVAAAPQLVLATLFVGWSLLTNLQYGVREIAEKSFTILVPFTLFCLLAHAVQTFRAVQVMMGAILAIGLALAAIGTHQGFAPWGCHRVGYAGGLTNLTFDGRPCSRDDPGACMVGNVEPGRRYVCERVGLLGTQTVGGRVRFRGAIEDPNELAIAVVTVIAIAFAFFERSRSGRALALLAATFALAGVCAVLTRSRTGQLVFAAVLGTWFLRRFGLRGAALATALALPILLLGGRAGEEATASAMERVDAWYAGLQMLRGSPVLGVGLNQFTEYHHLTAHNSYVLTAAELGLPGMLLWTSVLYVSLKIPFRALVAARGAGGGVPPVAVSWSVAMLAVLAGLLMGMLFLSYAYKEVLWLYLGLTGALYQAIRRHDPSFDVPFGWRDATLVAAASAAMLVATGAYVLVTV
jgi:hypothetical protein